MKPFVLSVFRAVALLVLITSPAAAQGIAAKSPGVDVAWSMLIPGSSDRYSDLRADARRLLDAPPHSLRGETDLACIAVAIYHEARSESTFGQLAVASVIQTRARTPGRWGTRPCDVVRPVQFSFMTSRYGYPPITERDAWVVAVNLAMKSLSDGPLPQLRKADHYHTEDVHPAWSREMILIGRIDNHLFYRDPESQM